LYSTVDLVQPMFDPLEMARNTERIVCRDDKRSYHRFRSARFYGGISTADCVGCCLRCIFCWSWREVTNPQKYGRLFSPDEVAERLIAIAKSKGYRQMRISGNEPTIGREHLLRVLDLIPQEYLFILETNGILIGEDPAFARDLSNHHNLHVRVSLKGTCEEEFARLTGARQEGFQLQLRALDNLTRNGVSVHPACMISFSPLENVMRLRTRLKEIGKEFEDFEIEELILYPAVEKRMKKMGIEYYKSHQPEHVPREQI
jgi:uncharacterized Fe-S cluster-containing radical SAM superfamily protein